MNDIARVAAAVALVIVGLVVWQKLDKPPSKAPSSEPAKPTPAPPSPCPGPNCPKKPNKPKPWKESSVPVGTITLGGRVAPDGQTEIQCDYPGPQWIKNIGSKVDGLGMCVTSSGENASRWANLEQLRGLRDWCAQQGGGADPQKVDRQLKEYAQAKGIQMPAYLQYEGPDPSILTKALKTGRLASVTYSGRDGVRYQGPIAHMVNLAHFDGQHAAIIDNNWQGDTENQILWMTVPEFVERWKSRGSGWAWIWLHCGPPPMPKN